MITPGFLFGVLLGLGKLAYRRNRYSYFFFCKFITNAFYLDTLHMYYLGPSTGTTSYQARTVASYTEMLLLALARGRAFDIQTEASQLDATSSSEGNQPASLIDSFSSMTRTSSSASSRRRRALARCTLISSNLRRAWVRCNLSAHSWLESAPAALFLRCWRSVPRQQEPSVPIEVAWTFSEQPLQNIALELLLLLLQDGQISS